LAGGGAGDQRATGTQAGGESQALRQWGEEGVRKGLRGAQRGGVAQGVALGGIKGFIHCCHAVVVPYLTYT